MRWLGVVVLASCGGKSPSHEQPLTNSSPPPALSQICEDVVSHVPPSVEMGLVIDDESFMERAMREHRPVLRKCYEQRLKYKPHLGGKVYVDITVGADGKAKHIRTRGFDEELDRCLCEHLAKVQFETLSGGEVKASYPFIFTSSSM